MWTAELRALAQFTATGLFRPLKSAPNLRRGWRCLAARRKRIGRGDELSLSWVGGRLVCRALRRSTNHVIPAIHRATDRNVPNHNNAFRWNRRCGHPRMLSCRFLPQAAALVHRGSCARCAGAKKRHSLPGTVRNSIGIRAEGCAAGTRSRQRSPTISAVRPDCRGDGL